MALLTSATRRCVSKIPANLESSSMIVHRTYAYQALLPERIGNNEVPPLQFVPSQANNEIEQPIMSALKTLGNSWLALDKSAQLGVVFGEQRIDADNSFIQ